MDRWCTQTTHNKGLNNMDRWCTQTTHNKSLYSSSLHFTSVSKLPTSTSNEYKNAMFTHLMLQ